MLRKGTGIIGQGEVISPLIEHPCGCQDIVPGCWAHPSALSVLINSGIRVERVLNVYI